MDIHEYQVAAGCGQKIQSVVKKQDFRFQTHFIGDPRQKSVQMAPVIIIIVNNRKSKHFQVVSLSDNTYGIVITRKTDSGAESWTANLFDLNLFDI